jgi:hypothetical protein
VQTYCQRRIGQMVLSPVPPIPLEIPAIPKTLFTAGMNFASHISLDSRRESSQDATLQFQLAVDGPLQPLFQVGYNLNNGQVQELAGYQEQADKDLSEVFRSLRRGLLKLTGFAQILGGVAWTGSPASGMFSVLQHSAGGQLTLKWHSIEFALQAGPSVTLTQGQPPTADFNATLQATVPLLKRPEPRTPSSELTGVFEVREWVEKSRYSEIERLPTDEQTRLISILLGDEVGGSQVDAVIRIWRSISSPMERKDVRQFIEERLWHITNPRLVERLRAALVDPASKVHGVSEH